MKRNSIFMWAYITFILLCALFRIIFSFSLWQPIVLAVTVSSIFFAAENFFSLQGRIASNTKNEAEKYMSMAKEQMEPILVKLKSLCENTRYLSTEDQSVSSFRGTVETSENDFNSHCEKLQDITMDLDKKSKKYKKAKDVMAFFGFLCLFLSLLIGSIISVPQIVQELLTVLSFAVVLASQQLEELYSKNIREIAIASEETIYAMKELSEETEATNKILEQFIEKKKHSIDTEEYSHAD